MIVVLLQVRAQDQDQRMKEEVVEVGTETLLGDNAETNTCAAIVRPNIWTWETS